MEDWRGLGKKKVAPTWGREFRVAMEVSPETMMMGRRGPRWWRSCWERTRPEMSWRWMSMSAAAGAVRGLAA